MIQLEEIIQRGEALNQDWDWKAYDAYAELVKAYYQQELGTLYTKYFVDVECDVSVNAGWMPIYVEAAKAIQTVVDENPGFHATVTQVKQKLGGLRLYCHTSRESKFEVAAEKIRSIIRAAEIKCDSTCETCGQPGELLRQGCIRVACKDHARL